MGKTKSQTTRAQRPTPACISVIVPFNEPLMTHAHILAYARSVAEAIAQLERNQGRRQVQEISFLR